MTTLPSITPGILLVSAGFLAAGGWLWWHREAPKTTTGLFLGAGATIGGVLGEEILTSPWATMFAGLVGLLGLGIGGWMWWLHGGKVSDSLTSLVLLVVGAIAMCLVAARLLVLLPVTPWSTSARLALATGVLILSAEVLVKGMWRGRARPRRYHPFLALALPTMAITVGVPVLSPAMTGLSGGLANVGTAMTTQPDNSGRTVHPVTDIRRDRGGSTTK